LVGTGVAEVEGTSFLDAGRLRTRGLRLLSPPIKPVDQKSEELLMRRLILALGTLALLACGDSTGPVQSLNGTYDLQTVNGASLPVTVSNDGFTREDILADAITVSGGSSTSGSFSEVSTLRDTDLQTGGSSTFQDTPNFGTYFINGTAVTFTFDNGTTANGTISGSTFTVVDTGLSLVYRQT
jgi:hypothetical protein